jgi:hypothetical protein
MIQYTGLTPVLQTLALSEWQEQEHDPWTSIRA